jgi:hypothetical protein
MATAILARNQPVKAYSIAGFGPRFFCRRQRQIILDRDREDRRHRVDTSRRAGNLTAVAITRAALRVSS